jgi:hypothetical protein
LLALSTLAGALLAWRISMDSDHAANADSTGLANLRQRAAEQTQALSERIASQDAFAAYHWRAALAGLTAAALALAPDAAQAADLERQQQAAANLAGLAVWTLLTLLRPVPGVSDEAIDAGCVPNYGCRGNS